MLDWQLVSAGSGLVDLAYFLAQSLTPEARRRDQDGLLRLYHETLREHGVRDYPFEACARDYRLGVLVAMWVAVMAAGVAGRSPAPDADANERRFQERAMALAKLLAERNVEAILDTGAASLLEA